VSVNIKLLLLTLFIAGSSIMLSACQITSANTSPPRKGVLERLPAGAQADPVLPLQDVRSLAPERGKRTGAHAGREDLYWRERGSRRVRYGDAAGLSLIRMSPLPTNDETKLLVSRRR
jgi:hypothetical protein